MSLKNIYTCDFKLCGLYLNEPITLPCGYSICKKHIDDTIEKRFECESCGKEHVIDENDLQVNLKTEKIIQMNLHLNDQHKKVKEIFDKLSKNISDFKQSKLFDGEHYLSDYFFEFRNQVDLHRELFINEINNKSDKLIEQLKSLEEDYLSNMKHLNQIVVEKFDKPEWNKHLRDPNINHDLLAKIEKEIQSSLHEFNKQCKFYENNLLMNCKIKFVPSNNINFGVLEIKSHKIIYSAISCYEGGVLDGVPNGTGTLTKIDGDKYQGEFKNGVIEGFGIYYEADGGTYKGNYLNDLRHGIGIYVSANKQWKYEGDWKNDKFNGFGIKTFSNGERYKGNFENNLMHGKGEYFTKSYRLQIEWKNGNKNGFGVYYFTDGDRYEVNYLDDKKNGKAKYIKLDGKVIKEKWLNGVKL